MNWLIRFSLGLPARPIDAKEVRELLPELQDCNWRPSKRYLMVGFNYDFYSPDHFIKTLRLWIEDIEEAQETFINPMHCPEQNCPLNLYREGDLSASSNEELNFYLRYQVAAGGPNSKPPRDAFFDLVKKVHAKADQPSEVILTDPYIYSDVSEDGLDGGFNNLVGYLKTLKIEQSDAFTLTTTPSPKRSGEISKLNLQRMLKKEFSNVTFKDFSPKLAFHDRLYIVRDNSGKLRGLFGPSLNGLSSSAIVLMGEITDPKPMQRIKSWLG